MKHNKLILITLFSAAAFATGCNKDEATSQQLDKVQAKTAEAAQDMKDYSYTQKDEFVAKMQGQLAEINKDLDQLAAKIEKSSDAAKAEAKPKLEALREQATKLNKQLDEAGSATESTWNDVKAGFKKGYGELKDSFQQARQWVSEKIAP
jgi:adenine-specific DNA methylase